MIHTTMAVTCESAKSPMYGPSCETLTPAEPTPESVAAVLAEHGWFTVGEQHYCPRHDPAMAGEQFRITSQDYLDLGRGVFVRCPPPEPGYGDFAISAIEVQLRDESQAALELENATARLGLARQALIKDGYFTASEVGDDIAPRLTEWLSHHCGRLEAAEKRAALFQATVKRARVLAVWWSGAPVDSELRSAARQLHDELDGPADEPEAGGPA